MERMHLETARKSASDRSAPGAGNMVADGDTFRPMRVFPKETFRAPRREPEGTSVPSVCFLGELY